MKSYQAVIDTAEKNYFIRLLKATHGNIAIASQLAKIGRNQIYSLCRKHNIDVEEYRNASR